MRLVSVIGQMASLDKVVYACGKAACSSLTTP